MPLNNQSHSARGRSGNNGNGFTHDSDTISSRGVFAGLPWLQSFWDDLTGYNAEQRQFEQQEHLLDREQDFVDERNRMQRLIEAGVNPNLAAQGVSGSSQSPSAPSVSGAGGNGASALNSVAGAVKSFAEADKAIEESKSIEDLLPEQLRKLSNDADIAFETVGLTRAEKESAIAHAKYAGESALLDIRTKRVNLSNVRQQLKNMRQQYQNLISEQDEIISRTLLNGSITEYNEALKTKIGLENEMNKAFNQFLADNGWDPRSVNGIENIVAMMVLNGKDPEPFLQAFLDYSDKYHTIVNDARNKSDINAAYDKAFNEALGRVEGSEAYETYKLMFDYAKDISLLFNKSQLDSSVVRGSTIAETLLNTILNKTEKLLNSLGYKIEFPDKPKHPQPKKRD